MNNDIISSSQEDYLQMSSNDLEQFLRRVIQSGIEIPKLDYKETITLDKNGYAALAKDIAAFANTDFPEQFNDFGFIILGVRKDGKFVGQVDSIKGDKCDAFNAGLTTAIKERLMPAPHIIVRNFEDPKFGTWGVIIIPQSQNQPHVFTRDANDITRGDCFVRIGSSTDRFQVHDFYRIIQKARQRELQPIQAELNTLQFRLKQLEEVRSDQMIRNLISKTAEPSGVATQNLEVTDKIDFATLIRHQVQPPEDALNKVVRVEASKIGNIIRSLDCDLHHETDFYAIFRERVKEFNTFMTPFLEGLWWLIVYEGRNRIEVIEDVLLELLNAAESKQSGKTKFLELQYYPLALTLEIIFVAAKHGNQHEVIQFLIKKDVQRQYQSHPEALLFRVFLKMLNLTDEFRAAYGTLYYVAALYYLHEFVVTFTAKVCPPARVNEAVAVGGFLVTLSRLLATQRHSPQFKGVMHFTFFLYEFQVALKQWLQTKPQFLLNIFGDQNKVVAVLDKFDEAFMANLQGQEYSLDLTREKTKDRACFN